MLTHDTRCQHWRQLLDYSPSTYDTTCHKQGKSWKYERAYFYKNVQLSYCNVIPFAHVKLTLFIPYTHRCVVSVCYQIRIRAYLHAYLGAPPATTMFWPFWKKKNYPWASTTIRMRLLPSSCMVVAIFSIQFQWVWSVFRKLFLGQISSDLQMADGGASDSESSDISGIDEYIPWSFWRRNGWI